MATAFIHSENKHFCRICKAYFEVYGHTVTCTSPIDVTIIDLDYVPQPTVETGILVYLSAREYRHGEFPKHALFRLKPVNIEALMDRILEILEQTI